MGLSLRIGRFGQYWGNDYNSSNYLSNDQRSVNAIYIYNYLSNKGWSYNSICATLGNMEAESTLNPGCWESHNVGGGPGYGLVQWTPFTNYTSWVRLGDASEIDNQLDRIIYELENGLQYYPTDSYPETFSEYTKSNKSIDYLTTAFLKNYERAGVERLDERISYANKWYDYLGGVTPTPPDGPNGTTKKRKGFNFVLFGRNRRNRIYG